MPPCARSSRSRAPLGFSVEEAAAGVYDLVNVTMAAGVREVSVRRGLDPRDFPLVVAGGAGPLHAAAIARELDIGALLVPRESSIFCAAGMLISDFKHDYVRAYKAPLPQRPAAVRTLFEEMSGAGRDTLSREGVTGEAVELRASLDLRYIGQWHELTVDVELPLDTMPPWPRSTPSTTALRPRVARRAGGGARAAAQRGRAHREARDRRRAGRPGCRSATRRAAGMGRGGARARSDSRLGRPEAGRSPRRSTVPAIVELSSTTIVVPRGFTLDVDAYGGFVVHSGERGAEFARRLEGVVFR